MNAAREELRLRAGCVSAGGVVSRSGCSRAPIEAIGKTGPGAGEAHQPGSMGELVEARHRIRGGPHGRMVGVFDVGRVLNEKTAANQIIGGMVWGVAYALSEDAIVDVRTGRFINPDFGEYHVAVNADVPQIEVHFIEEVDRSANPVGAKGVGELGISGAGAAVVNAIYNATGVRVRDMPVTLDKLLSGLPPV